MCQKKIVNLPKFKIGDKVKIVDKYKDSLQNGTYTIKDLKKSKINPDVFIYKLNKNVEFYVNENWLEKGN